MAKQRCRIGIDVGGTFTDFVLANMATGELTRYKEPSVPADPSKSVERGLPPLMELAGVEPENVELIVHGTTLLVNAIIQRKGAKVALVVSKGHRGILEIGRARLANSYDFTVQKEEPLVKRNLIYETESRTMADGTIIGRPARGELKAVAEQIKAQDIEAVTILLLHSYAHPEMEQLVAKELRKRLGKIPVTESAHIWPARREFERSLIAIMNAYVNPLMTAYLNLLIKRVESLKIKAPIYITANNGGTLSIDTARDRPIDTILSGPASGVVAAPCGAPAFAVVLTWVAATQAGVMGFVYLFVFSFGMTALLVAVGLFSGFGAALPAAGRWMVWIKKGAAVIMLLMAQYYFVQVGMVL